MIKLKHPPVIDSNGNLSKKPFDDFDPKNSLNYYEIPSVYIYGTKVIVDGILKFVPITVGETKNLNQRLYKNHYNGKIVKPLKSILKQKPTTSSEKKEIWDFSNKTMNKSDIIDIYNDMSIYNTINIGEGRTSLSFLSNLQSLQKLIFFQNENYFNIKFGLTFKDPHSNISPAQSVLSYPQTSSKIINTLQNFNDNFYYVYADEFDNLDFPITELRNRLNVEVKLKNELSTKFGINTTADSKRKGNEFDVSFDFSEIENILIDLNS